MEAVKKFNSLCIKESKLFGLKLGEKYRSEIYGNLDGVKIFYSDNNIVGSIAKGRWFFGDTYFLFFVNLNELRKSKIDKINGRSSL